MGKRTCAIIVATCCAWISPVAAYEAPLGGFIPFVGLGLTNEFDPGDQIDFDDPLFNGADVSYQWGGSPLGPGANAYFDVALLDSGAATHILTQAAASATGFNIQAEGFRGNKFQEIFGPTGNPVSLRINDPLGVYVAGLKPGTRTSASGAPLTMATGQLKGQTSVSMLEGDANWALPNIIGLPMAAQHGLAIRNSQPQIFQHQGRTMRTPHVDLIDLGSGADQNIVRWTSLRLNPGASFIAGPVYVNDFLNFENPHDNPASPTVVDSGGIYIDVDLKNETANESNVRFLFDTGADITVISPVLAASLGLDIVEDEPDFVVEVEGGGGVLAGVPGFYLDELKIDAVGGSIVVQNAPVVVLEAPNPADPANTIDAILGMHIFSGRDLVIDAAPAALGLGGSPKLFISDPVSQVRTWSTSAASASWGAGSSWASATGPQLIWSAQAVNFSGSNQTAVVSSNSEVYDLKVAGTPTAKMSVAIQTGATLTTFGETRIDAGGEIRLNGGKLDAPFVNIYGGELTGQGTVYVGTGILDGTVRNLGGRVAPDGVLTVTGDLSNQAGGTIAFDLFTGGNDMLDVSRSAYLHGTLDIDLTGGFTPTLNQVFTLLSYEDSIVLDFDVLELPPGYQWDLSVNSLAKTVELEMIGITNLPGDFNGDTFVDEADLAYWEAHYGPGGLSGADFLVWQQNYSPSGLSAATSVPEPTAAVLTALSMLALAMRRPHRSAA